jgi:pre-mRNA-splicing factor ATP-dependent RNA helicase DHX15/PRP43
MERHDLDLVTITDENKLHDAIKQTLVCGFFSQVAHKEGDKGAYVTVKDNQVSRNFGQ